MRKFLSILLFFSAFTLKAQEYQTGVGLRLGAESGITIKHFLNETAAVEGIVGTSYWGGFYACGLYEMHIHNLADVSGLSLYFGGGAHLRTWSGPGWGWGRGNSYLVGRASYIGIGADLIFGAEYKIPDAPFTLSLDLKPAVDIIESFWFHGGGGLSVRYTF